MIGACRRFQVGAENAHKGATTFLVYITSQSHGKKDDIDCMLLSSEMTFIKVEFFTKFKQSH